LTLSLNDIIMTIVITFVLKKKETHPESFLTERRYHVYKLTVDFSMYSFR